jgi:hypothetical protein
MNKTIHIVLFVLLVIGSVCFYIWIIFNKILTFNIRYVEIFALHLYSNKTL